MDLHNFERYIDKLILERGFKYYNNGYIISVDETHTNFYEIEIEGSSIYSVKVELEDNNKIKFSDCDCPYDMGKYCKHQVAAFYYLKHFIYDRINQEEKEKFNLKKHKQEKMLKILEKSKKEKLINFIISLSKESKKIENLIFLNFDDCKDDSILKRYQDLISFHIEKKIDYNGFISYYSCKELIDELEPILKKAKVIYYDGEHITAIKIIIILIRSLVQTYNHSDDSDGWINSFTEICFMDLNDMISYNENIENAEKQEIYNILFEESLNSQYDEWYEWQTSYLEICLELIHTEEMKNHFKINVEKMISQKDPNDTYGDLYFINDLKSLLYKLFENFTNENEGSEFLLNNLDIPKFRELAIQNAIDKKDYKTALSLIEEGYETKPNLNDTWEKYKYEIYKEQNDIEKLKNLAIRLIERNKIEYYYDLKKILGNNWKKSYENIIQKFEKNYFINPETYARILVEEKDFERLLKFVQKNPIYINSNYKYIIHKYPKEVNEIFFKYIKVRSKNANNRSHYKSICSEIKSYKKLSNMIITKKIIDYLMEENKRKPAFIDELRKLKISIEYS